MAWGRVALLLAAADATKAHLDEVASLVAYKPNPDKPTPQADKPPAPERQPTQDVSSAETLASSFPEMVFWQIDTLTTLTPPETDIPAYLSDTSKAAQFNAQKAGTFIFAAPHPLATLTQLAPLLINSLGRKVQSPALDHHTILRRISQGKPLTHLFYRQRRCWPLQLTILVDKHNELFPYWPDFDHLVSQLQTRLGERNVQVLSLHERNVADFVLPRQGLHPNVLILSDLHDYANSHRYWAWQALLAAVHKQASAVLTLSTAKQSPSATTLSKRARINSLTPPQGYVRHAKTHGFSIPLKTAQLEFALTLISPLALVDSGLLRKLRTTFHCGNPVLEGELWNDPRVVQSVLGIRLQPTVQEHYRAHFKSLPASTQQRFWALVEAHHQNAYQGLLTLERTSKMALSHTSACDQAQTIEYLQALLAHRYQQDSTQTDAQVTGQLKTLVNFIPQAGWQASRELAELLHQAYALAYRDELRNGDWPHTLPAGLDLTKLRPLIEQGQTPQPQALSLYLAGLQGEAQLRQPSTESSIALLTLITTTTQPALWQASRNTPSSPLQSGQFVSLAKAQTAIIKTSNRQWQLKGISRPDYAQNIGQDQQGLYIETDSNTPAKRYYWIPGQVDEQHNHYPGAWFPQASLPEKVNRDQYGLYTDLTIKHITQRFRYIAPGRFLMGSPKDEPERESWGKETQHPVTLTEGFWLADTAVTQALYQAVTGNNPSHFKEDLQQPVEQVSWDDAQWFMQQLNQLMPALNAQLPTEAQWEYACRAGTSTPFSFGAAISPEQVNYDGNHPYAHDEKGPYRNKTVAVKSLPANPWGLYEMHGNVWEWCQDAYSEDLGARAVTDPLGTAGGVKRVVRGGSWGSSGRGVRSAIRDRYSPVYRNGYLGLRLALGLELQPGPEHAASQQGQARRDDAKAPAGGQGAVDDEALDNLKGR